MNSAGGYHLHIVREPAREESVAEFQCSLCLRDLEAQASTPAPTKPRQTASHLDDHKMDLGDHKTVLSWGPRTT